MRSSVLALLTALLPACAAPADGGAGSGGRAPQGAWELAGGTVDGTPLPIPAGAAATLEFGPGELRGRSFCNGYSGSYRLDGDRIAVDGLGGSEMGCDPPVMAAESAFLAGLAAVERHTRDGDELVLTGGGAELRFTPVAPVVDRDVVGTQWVLETLVDGETAASTVGEPAVLHLAEDGGVEGSTGCRALTGTWTARADEILLGDLRADGECPDGVVRQDRQVVEVLGDGFRPQVTGDRLTVSGPGGLGLIYRAG